MNSEIKSHFPIFKTKNYLASHSLGAAPIGAQTAMQEYYDVWSREGILAWDGHFVKAIQTFQNQIEMILDAPTGTVVPMENVTRGFAAVSSLWDWGTQKQKKKNKILMTDKEFSTSYPFFKGLERMGAELVLVRSTDGITVDIEDWLKAIDEQVLLIATSHVFFRSGYVQDLKKITEAAHRVGAFVLGDGYQGVGTVPVSVQSLGVDFYVGGSHKWLCGGPGAGFLYVSKSVLDEKFSQPAFSGWFGLEDPFGYQPGTEPVLSSSVNRFLAGTPAIPALYAAREGLNWILKLGLPAIRAHSILLTEKIRQAGEERGWTLRSPKDPEKRSGMICFDFKGAEQLTRALEKQGIVIDYRPLAGIRVSPHFYSTADDIEDLFSKIDILTKADLQQEC